MWPLYLVIYYLTFQTSGYEWYTGGDNSPKNPNDCWQKYTTAQPDICMDRTSENRIAQTLDVVTCYLQESRRKIPQCATIGSPCLLELTEEQFHVYTLFYTHWDVICSHEINKKIIPEFRLMISNVQTRMAAIQEGTATSGLLDQATGNALEAVKAVNQENQLLLLSIFQRVNAIHQHEVYDNTFNMALWYYCLVYCIIYAFTTFERTSYVRVYMFGILALSSLAEWYLTAPENTETIATAATMIDGHTSNVIENLWKIRHITTLINTIVWVFGLYHYQDRKEASQRVLSGISDNVADLKGRVDQLKNCDDLKAMPAPLVAKERNRTMADDTSDSNKNSSYDSSVWPGSSDSQAEEWKFGTNSGEITKGNSELTAGETSEGLDGDAQENSVCPRDLKAHSEFTATHTLAGPERTQQRPEQRRYTKEEQERHQALTAESRRPCRRHNILYCRACFNFNKDGTITI